LENGEVAAVSSLQETGYHTTPAEITDRHSIFQTPFTEGIFLIRKKINHRINSSKLFIE